MKLVSILYALLLFGGQREKIIEDIVTIRVRTNGQAKAKVANTCSEGWNFGNDTRLFPHFELIPTIILKNIRIHIRLL